jgi:hypothetical protein
MTAADSPHGIEVQPAAAPTHPLVKTEDMRGFVPKTVGPIPSEFGTEPKFTQAALTGPNLTPGGESLVIPAQVAGKGAMPAERGQTQPERAQEQGEMLILRSNGLFKDDPSLSPTERSIRALMDVTKSKGKISDEDKKAFEGSIAKADEEAKSGGSPRIAEMQKQLADMDKTLSDPNFGKNLQGMADGLNEQIRALSPDQRHQLQLLMGLRAAGLGGDSEINKLLPGKNAAGESFTEQVDKFNQLNSMPKDQAHLKDQIKLEQGEAAYTREGYALALFTAGDSGRAKEFMTKAIELYPEVKKDPFAQKLMQQLGIKPEQPL